MGWIFVGIGAFTLCGAVMDWDWFMNSRRARFFVKVFGRAGARVVYGLLGAAFVTFGLLTVLGVIQPSS
ncbi:MAG: immunity 17 family protein [Cyanobacteria bacterium P01_E01_bin.45]